MKQKRLIMMLAVLAAAGAAMALVIALAFRVP